MLPPLGSFRDPPWSAPLDASAAIERVPSTAMISGLFLAAVVDGAKAKSITLPSARPSYTAFRRYLLREHCTIMVEAAQALWPDETLRQGLRKLGRGAPRALLGSMLGRVVLGSVEGPLDMLRAMAKSYGLHAEPGSLEIVPLGPGRAVVRMREIHHFLDSHHVGVFEGVLRFAGVEGARVRIHATSVIDADVLCEWRVP